MSRDASPRAVAHDWPALLDRARSVEARPLSDEELALWRRGLFDGSASWHATDYVHALQRSIEGRDHVPLRALLAACVPFPAWLGPLVADALRAAEHGSIAGRASRLTALDDAVIRDIHDRLMQHGHARIGDVREFIAACKGTSVDTIRRSLERAATRD